jgi:hypothetical protein
MISTASINDAILFLTSVVDAPLLSTCVLLRCSRFLRNSSKLELFHQVEIVLLTKFTYFALDL